MPHPRPIPHAASRPLPRVAGTLLALALFGATAGASAETLTFSARQNFTTGASPHGLTVADLNGDGKPDLVVTNLDDDNISVLLNTTAAGATTPTFATQQTFAAGVGATAVTAVDMNNDGKLDLVVANAPAATISVFLNTTAVGATTVSFAAQQTFDTGQYPFFVAAVDLDGDGKADLITADAGSTAVSLFHNTTADNATTVTFAARQPLQTDFQPASIAVADFNADGKPDFVSANFGSDTISLMINTTTAGASAFTFADKVSLPTGTTPSSIAVGDINGDGKLDIVVVNAFDYNISVLLNTTAPGATTPTFAARQNYLAGIGPASVALVDINGDGKLDIVVPNQADKNVSVYVNQMQAGGVNPIFSQQKITVGTDPVNAQAVDVNADGTPDLIVVNNQDKNVSVLLNTTAPSGIPLNQHGLSGSWIKLATPGQGIELEIYPNLGGLGQGAAFGGWFTYDTAAGAPRWYSLQGGFTASSPVAQLGIYAGYGGNFAAAPDVPATQVGTATLRFTDCSTGVLTYQFDDGRSGTMSLTRLTSNLTCTPTGDSSNAPAGSLLSGSWFDNATSGQGLIFDVNPAQNVFFAGWYTYAPNGAATGGAGSERWYVIQAAYTAGAASIQNAPIYAASGGVFDGAANPTVTQVGSANITFTSCGAATLDYAFTAGDNNGLSGTLHLIRTGPTPVGCSL